MYLEMPSPSLFALTLLVLIFCHFLADFPLQGDFLARAKSPMFGDTWTWVTCMVAHCSIHAGFVLLATRSVFLAGFQFVTHFIIDYAKLAGWFGGGSKAFVMDQALHVLVMITITVLYCFAGF